jgi:phosphonate transport system substrate-binding protein
MVASRSWSLAALLLCVPLAAQRTTGAPAAERVTLRFGVYTSDKPTEMYRKFQPVIDALNRSTASVAQRPIDIQLQVFSTYEQAHEALLAREVDFVRFGPSSYVLCKKRDPKVTLLAMEEIDGKKRFEGMIVVRADSPIRKLEDLRGRTFAFGDPTSTIGRYLAQNLLVSAGITAKDLKRVEYLGRHDKVFRAVEFGDFDAGSLKTDTFEKLNAATQPLRVLVRFENVTKPWIARSGLDPEVKSALRQALLSLSDEAALAELAVSGFGLATDSMYDSVRQGMKGARRFDGLPEEETDITTSPHPQPPAKSGK